MDRLRPGRLTDLMRTVILLTATIMAGVMSGVFFTYSNSVLPGLRQVDDRTFVHTMQRINVAIVNPWFLLTFLGTLVFAGLAAVLHLQTGALPWIVAAFGLYLAQLIITFSVNVPLNNQLDAASLVEAAVARVQFEAAWVRWNHLRTVASLGAFISLVIAVAVAQDPTHR